MKSLSYAIKLAGIAASLLVMLVQPAYASSLGAYYGRSDNYGYFTNSFDTAGTYLFSSGGPTGTGGMPASNTTEFINIINSRLNGSNTQDVTGAAFIIDTMLDKKAGDFGGSRSAGVNYAISNYNTWKSIVTDYGAANQISYNVSTTLAVNSNNSYYQGAGDDAFYLSNVAETQDVIIFSDSSNNPIYEIKQNCGNVIGASQGLPPMGATLRAYKVVGGSGTGDTVVDGININVSGGGGGNSTSNPAVWNSISSGSHTVAPTTAPAAASGYYYDSYQICDNGACQPITNVPNAPPNPISGRTFAAQTGHDYKIYFIYQKPGPGTVTIVKDCDDATPACAAAVSGIRMKITGTLATGAPANPNVNSGTKWPVVAGSHSMSMLDFPTAGSGYANTNVQVCKNGTCGVNGGVPQSPPAAANVLTRTIANGEDWVIHFHYRKGGPTAICVSNSANPAMNLAPGAAFTLNVTMKNAASPAPAWTSAGGFELDSVSTGSPWDGMRIALPSSPVANGASVTFAAQLTAPSTAGDYDATWEMSSSASGLFAATCPGSIHVQTSAIAQSGKIYAANVITTGTQFVRDNFKFAFDLLAYFWPDTASRSINNSGSSRHYWESGLYNSTGAGNVNFASFNANNLNSKNEANCPTQPQCQVPLAYVPQADANAKTTPNGNNWYSILTNSFSGSYDVCTAGNYGCKGGIASTSGAKTINNVEISNIHVAATGISMDPKEDRYQGGVADGILQHDAEQATGNGAAPYLQTGSQGPRNSSGTPIVAWDNIRNPNNYPADFSTATDPASTTYEYLNDPASGPSNFAGSPDQMWPTSIASVLNKARKYGTANVVSLLQDGQDGVNSSRQYPNPTEPLSYSTTVTKADDVTLLWDEYVDWSQTDNKGHYYTTKSAAAPIGVDPGPVTHGGTNTTYYAAYNLDTNGNPNTGSQQVAGYTYSYSTSCTTGSTGGTQYQAGAENSSLEGTTVYNGCQWTSTSANYTTTSPVCTDGSTQPTSFSYTDNTLAFYKGSNQSKYGWVRSGITPSPSIPWGTTDGGTVSSYFASDPSANPAWANVNNYWQPNDPTNLGLYDDGSSAGLTDTAASAADYSANHWILDTSDKAYTDRFVYNTDPSGAYVPSFHTGYTNSFTQSCVNVYPNGSASVKSQTNNLEDYYASATLNYENTPSVITSSLPNGTDLGTYNQTYDGQKDGSVDVGWAWTDNNVIVRYQQTFNKHSKDLLSRCQTPVSGCEQLYGLNGNNAPVMPSRGTSTIYNPTIQADNADIYSGQNVDSYFSSSNLSSAFIFAKGSIASFNAANAFAGYDNNFNQKSRTQTLDPNGTKDPVHFVFDNFDANILGKAVAFTGDLSHLNGKIYKTTGDLDLNASLVCGGAGTLVVQGNLHIHGNVTYDGCAVPNKAALPSLGVIVTGNITIDPSVSKIVGAYFANGSFSSGSYLTADGSDKTNGDGSLLVSGLVIANKFNLERQPLGTQLQSLLSGNLSAAPERFSYDGRIVVSPPPGFTYIFTAPAAWNESVPYTQQTP